MSMIPRLLTVLLLLACNLPVIAQTEEETTEEEPLRIYDVEVILFKNLQGPRGLEYIRPSLLPSKAESAVEIQSPDSIKAAAEVGYELLQQDDFKLLEQVEKIIQSSRYELMLHAGWRQPGLAFEESIPVWIRGGNLYGSEYSSIDFRAQNYPRPTRQVDSLGAEDADSVIDENSLAAEQDALDAILDPGAEAASQPMEPTGLSERTSGGLYELEGKITVSLARFLHVNADLVFRKPRPLGAVQVGVFNNPNSTAESSKILENHRLQERRRMRSSRLHYLDSPHFSMLVMISPYEIEQEDTGSTGNGEAASVTPLTE